MVSFQKFFFKCLPVINVSSGCFFKYVNINEVCVAGYPGYVLFSWLYGIFCGGFHYALKMFTYEKVRARNFARTWGFVQCSQAIPTALGVPITGMIFMFLV